MAVRIICYSSPCSCSLITNIHPNNKCSFTKRLVMISQSQRDSHHIDPLPLIQIRSSSSSIKLHKVFEDESNGIVCYRDEKGVITCEGFDEGPRLQPGFARFTRQQRDAKAIVDLLQRSLLEEVVDVGNNQ